MVMLPCPLMQNLWFERKPSVRVIIDTDVKSYVFLISCTTKGRLGRCVYLQVKTVTQALQSDRWVNCIFQTTRMKLQFLTNLCTVWQVSKCGVFSGPYFPAFGLNTERYGVSLCIQSECGKIRTRKKLRIWTLFTQWWRLATLVGNYETKPRFHH